MSRFSVENNLSHSSEKFRRGTLLCCVPESFWYRKNLGITRGAITILRRKRFCLTVPKNFVGEPFSVPLFLGIDKFNASEGFVSRFLSKISCLTVPKFFVGDPFRFSLVSGIEKC